jgi:hypothetical protein
LNYSGRQKFYAQQKLLHAAIRWQFEALPVKLVT